MPTAPGREARPPRPRARRLSPEARRAQLLGCALRVFARRGIEAARHAEIAAEAGVSVPAVFSYFETRAALVRAVLDEVARFYLDMARRVHAAGRPPAAALLDHARAFADSVDTNPDHARIFLEWSSAVREDVWPRYLAFEQQVVAVIAATLRRGQRERTIAPDVASEDGARIAIGAGHMIVHMKLSRRPAPEVDRFLDAVVRALAGGLGTPRR